MNFIAFSELTKEKTSLEESLAAKLDALEDLSRENCEKQEVLISQKSQQSGENYRIFSYIFLKFFVNVVIFLSDLNIT